MREKMMIKHIVKIAFVLFVSISLVGMTESTFPKQKINFKRSFGYVSIGNRVDSDTATSSTLKKTFSNDFHAYANELIKSGFKRETQSLNKKNNIVSFSESYRQGHYLFTNQKLDGYALTDLFSITAKLNIPTVSSIRKLELYSPSFFYSLNLHPKTQIKFYKSEHNGYIESYAIFTAKSKSNDINEIDSNYLLLDAFYPISLKGVFENKIKRDLQIAITAYTEYLER